MPDPCVAFFDFVTHFGGSAGATARMVQRMRRSVDVRVVDAYGICEPYIAELRAAQVPVYVVQPSSRHTVIGGCGYGQRLSRLIRRGPGLLQFKARLARLLGELNCEVIWTNSQKGLYFLSRAAPRLPKVFYVHGELRCIHWYCRRDWKKVRAAVTLSTSCLDLLNALPVAPQRTEIIRIGIDIDDVLKRAAATTFASPSPVEGRCQIVLPGTLSPVKAQRVAIEAVAYMARAGMPSDLWLCGDVPAGASSEYADSLLPLAMELGVAESVHFLGWRKDVLSIMAAADVVMLCSVTEGTPVSILEAMAMNKPVVATRVGGIPEMIVEGQSGLLVQPNDPQSLGEALMQLRDPLRRAEFGAVGRERVQRLFSLDAQAEAMIATLRSAVAMYRIARR